MTKYEYKMYSLLEIARKSVEDDEYIWDDGFISNNGKTDAFIKRCERLDIDYESLLKTIVLDDAMAVGYMRMDYNFKSGGDVLIWELSTDYSKKLCIEIGESLYVKVGFDKTKMLNVVFHAIAD